MDLLFVRVRKHLWPIDDTYSLYFSMPPPTPSLPFWELYLLGLRLYLRPNIPSFLEEQSLES